MLSFARITIVTGMSMLVVAAMFEQSAPPPPPGGAEWAMSSAGYPTPRADRWESVPDYQYRHVDVPYMQDAGGMMVLVQPSNPPCPGFSTIGRVTVKFRREGATDLFSFGHIVDVSGQLYLTIPFPWDAGAWSGDVVVYFMRGYALGEITHLYSGSWSGSANIYPYPSRR